MDWYQGVAIIAFIIAVGAGWEVLKLRKHLHMDDLTPTKKWTKAIAGKKYIPKHKPDQIPNEADEDDLRFFRDFYRAADYLNELYADEPWSFENTGRLDLAHYGSENGSEREILIRYNQQQTGTIKLSCIHCRRDNPFKIHADLSLQNSRIFRGSSVFGLARSVSDIVVGDEDVRKNNSSIIAAMVDVMWQLGDETIGNPDLDLNFRGNADWFLTYQTPKADQAFE